MARSDSPIPSTDSYLPKQSPETIRSYFFDWLYILAVGLDQDKYWGWVKGWFDAKCPERQCSSMRERM